MCGVCGLGRLLSEGQTGVLDDLQMLAADPRWRIREAVAMALQRWGDRDMDALLAAMQPWAVDSPLVQRAGAAALCEPRLLQQRTHAAKVLRILDTITSSLALAQNRRTDEYRTLRQGLGYCWSVAVAALPDLGKPLMERWLSDPDPDIRWVVRENLKKNRLLRLDPEWAHRALAALDEERQAPG